MKPVAVAAPMIVRVLAALLIVQASSPARAANPSFACSGSLTPTEKTICSDETLAALDRALALLHRRLQPWRYPRATLNFIQEDGRGLGLAPEHQPIDQRLAEEAQRAVEAKLDESF